LREIKGESRLRKDCSSWKTTVKINMRNFSKRELRAGGSGIKVGERKGEGALSRGNHPSPERPHSITDLANKGTNYRTEGRKKEGKKKSKIRKKRSRSEAKHKVALLNYAKSVLGKEGGRPLPWVQKKTGPRRVGG